MSTSVGASAQSIQADFMKLLVTQLQNQNPMEPLDNNQMATQLAQLSSLEQLEHMNGTFQEVLASQQRTQAAALIGKEVEYVAGDTDNVLVGRVDEVNVYDTDVRLSIGADDVPLDAVTSIRN